LIVKTTKGKRGYFGDYDNKRKIIRQQFSHLP
jgi:hypothetical protein